MTPIFLLSEDDFASVSDQIQQTLDNQVALILAEDQPHLGSELDWIRIDRLGRQRRQEIGVVTRNRSLIPLIEAAGLPIFIDLEAAEDEQRIWRRARRTRPVVGLRPKEIDYQLEARAYEQRQVIREQNRPSWQRWLRRYALIWVGCAGLAAVMIALIYLIPSGTVYLTPYTESIEQLETILADPTRLDPAGPVIPARRVTTTVEWETEITTSGQVAIPDAPARGLVVFTNLSGQGVELAAGTELGTPDQPNIRYQLVQDVTVPSLFGGTVEANIVALTPGPDGNQEANRLTVVFDRSAEQLEVTNPQPITGGASRITAAVTEQDLERLRSQIIQYAQGIAVNELQSELDRGEVLAIETVIVSQIVDESVSHQVNEPTPTVSMQLSAELSGLVADTDQAIELLFNRMSQAVPTGFELIPESFRMSTQSIETDPATGTLILEVRSTGQIAAEVDPTRFTSDISGQNPEIAAAYLDDNLLLDRPPVTEISPSWFGRLPLWGGKIRYIVQEQGEAQ